MEETTRGSTRRKRKRDDEARAPSDSTNRSVTPKSISQLVLSVSQPIPSASQPILSVSQPILSVSPLVPQVSSKKRKTHVQPSTSLVQTSGSSVKRSTHMTASTRRANYTVIPVDAAVIPKKAGSPKRNVKKYVGGGVGVVATTPATTTPTTVITAAVPEVREWADLVGNVAVIKRVCDNIVILQQSESQERGRRAKQAAEFAILAEKVERATHATDVARTAASRRASANAILHAFPDDGDDEEDSSNPPQTQSRARTISNERDVHQRRHSKSKDKYPSQHSHGGPKSRNSKGNSNVFNRKGATEARGKEKAGGNDKKKKGGVSANANEKERKTVDRDEEEEEKEAEKEDVALMQLSETSNRLERQQTRLLNEEREYRTMQQAHLKKIMLLHGPPGVGKSSCTRLIARHLGRRAVILNMSLLRNREQVSELVRTLVFRKTSVPPLPALFTPLSSSSSSSSSSSTLSLHHTNSASVARSSPPPSSSPTHKPPPPPSPRDLVAAASAGRVVDDMIRRVDSTTVTNEKFATTGKNIYVTGKNIYVTGKPIYVTAKDEEARKRKAVEEARVKVAAAEAFREMVDPVLVVLEEMDGMSPQGMAALAALFKEISESPREFQPLLCVCNDTTKLKKYKIMSYMHGHLFESLTQPALSTIAERNGFMTWNTPRLAALVTEARGDARHLLHSLALDNHRRPPPPLSIPPSLSIPPPLSIPIPLASSSNITRHVTTPPTTSKGGWAHQNSSMTLTATVDALFAQAYVRREMSVEATLAVYRGSAYAVNELVGERYTSRKTVADIDAALESADGMLHAAVIGNVRNTLPSSTSMSLLPLNSAWLPLQRFCPQVPRIPLHKHQTQTSGTPTSISSTRPISHSSPTLSLVDLASPVAPPSPSLSSPLLSSSSPPLSSPPLSSSSPRSKNGIIVIPSPIQVQRSPARTSQGVTSRSTPSSAENKTPLTRVMASPAIRKEGAAIVPFRPMTAETFMRYKTTERKLHDLLASTSSLSRTLDALTSTMLPFCERHNMTEREAFGFQQTFI